MCQASSPSTVCPGPHLPPNIKAGSPEDLRCPPCKFRGGGITPSSQERRIHLIADTMHKAMDWLKHSSNPSRMWADFADATLVELFYDMAGFFLPCRFGLVLVGSLGRREATPFSDAEFFIVLKKEDAEKHFYTFYHIADQMYRKLVEVTKATKAFGEDFYFASQKQHITLDTTFRSIEKYLPEEQPQPLVTAAWDSNIIRMAVLGGRCILGDTTLFDELRSNYKNYAIKRDVILRAFQDDLFDKGGSVLDAWRTRGDKNILNVKKFILRPCTFIVSYLGAYHNLPGVGNRAHLMTLKQQQKISTEVYTLLNETMALGEQLRWSLHLHRKEESDDLSLKDVGSQYQKMAKTCLDNVSMLLGISRRWLERKLKLVRANQEEKPFLTKQPSGFRYKEFEQHRN